MSGRERRKEQIVVDHSLYPTVLLFALILPSSLIQCTIFHVLPEPIMLFSEQTSRYLDYIHKYL